MDVVTGKQLRVTVIDMQPITPAVGGGRQRLLGLYHALGPDIACTYVGSYDWPGESLRDQQLTPGLREIVVPLSHAHHEAAAALSRRTGGRTVIDIAFADQVHLSGDYLATARKHAMEADVVVFSHPWAYAAVADVLRADQLVAYESHNVEGLLRMSLHDDLPAADPLVRGVVALEYRLCREADLILACSQEDREIFARVYDASWDKLRVAPNGIFAFTYELPVSEQRAAAKKALRVDKQRLVVFVGSNYGPNNDAAAFVADNLACDRPDVAFALIGGCCDRLQKQSVPSNVILLGTLDEEAKHAWMRAADVAVNPLSAGSGTSIKMFDFMAAGLPTVTTRIGARGICSHGVPPFVVAELDGFGRALDDLLADACRLKEYAALGRKNVESFYAWERISPAVGRLLSVWLAAKFGPRPHFTVVIPTYERHQLLDQLVLKLEAQTERDFDVIVVDQSASPWPAAQAVRRFPLRYVHSEIKGAVAARNLGGSLATGRIIAFTDDDCEPAADWLKNGRAWFGASDVVGVEGLIRSDHIDEPEWREVTNVGFEGIGFMTANLMVRNAAFQQLGGFDPAFDSPHFREDTDFGWRLQAIGEVPYATDVEVFHPAQRRDIQRESQAERNRFFEKDALLLKKHPEKYRQLFFMEGHYRKTDGFWVNLQRGLELYGVGVPEWMAAYQPTQAGKAPAEPNGWL
jgi:glycosyltransferase involved in cell wall biosynthesis/GT2 family glycosyltransferase